MVSILDDFQGAHSAHDGSQAAESRLRRPSGCAIAVVTAKRRLKTLIKIHSEKWS